MSPLPKVLKVRDAAYAVLGSAVPLVIRLVIGHGFTLTGWGKLHNLEKVTGYFQDLGIPFPGLNAGFIGTLELVGGLALLVGLGTRLFAALLSATMIVALLTADRQHLIDGLTPGSDQSLTDIVPLVFLMLLGALAAFGPGRLSLDQLIVKLAPERYRAYLRPSEG